MLRLLTGAALRSLKAVSSATIANGHSLSGSIVSSSSCTAGSIEKRYNEAELTTAGYLSAVKRVYEKGSAVVYVSKQRYCSRVTYPHQIFRTGWALLYNTAEYSLAIKKHDC